MEPVASDVPQESEGKNDNDQDVKAGEQTKVPAAEPVESKHVQDGKPAEPAEVPAQSAQPSEAAAQCQLE